MYNLSQIFSFTYKSIDVSHIIYDLLGVYALLLVIVGTVGNVLTLVICIRQKLRKHACFVFLSFISVCDIFTLYTWNLSNFTVPFLSFYHEHENLIWCKISVFVQFFSLQSSAWLLVAMSIERFLSIRIRNWYSAHFNAKKAVYVSISVIITLFVFNVHLLILNGYTTYQNETHIVTCYHSTMIPEIFTIWDAVHNYMYSLIPFLFLVIFNVLLCHRMMSKSNNIQLSSTQSSVAKRRAMTTTIMLVTVAFFVTTAPMAIATGYFLDELDETLEGHIILALFDSFAFSFHSFNFLVFLVFNKQFRREFKEIVLRLRKKKIGPFNLSSMTTT